jgi:ADP-ribose pyrophosphatase YjhB (NUDIX family)
MNNALSVNLSKVGTETTCSGVAIVRNGKILIGLRHYTPDKWKQVSLWTIPGGRCDAGETIEAALRRETAEETGITRLKIVGFLGEMPGVKPGDDFYLFAGETNNEPRLKEPEKFSEWRWEDITAVPKNFINPAALALIKEYYANKP